MRNVKRRRLQVHFTQHRLIWHGTYTVCPLVGVIQVFWVEVDSPSCRNNRAKKEIFGKQQKQQAAKDILT